MFFKSTAKDESDLLLKGAHARPSVPRRFSRCVFHVMRWGESCPGDTNSVLLHILQNMAAAQAAQKQKPATPNTASVPAMAHVFPNEVFMASGNFLPRHSEDPERANPLYDDSDHMFTGWTKRFVARDTRMLIVLTVLYCV